MAGVLSKIVKTDAETKEHLESIDTTLTKIYELHVGTEKREAKEAKRKAQNEKRSKGDTFLDRLKLDPKEKKKARKGFLESLGEFFGKLGGGLTSGLGGLLKNLFAVKGPIANIIKGAFTFVFRTGGKVVSGMVKAIGGILGSPFFWKSALGVLIAGSAIKGAQNLTEAIGKSQGRSGKTKKETIFEYVDIQQLREQFLQDQLNQGITGGEEHDKMKQRYLDLMEHMRLGKKEKERYDKLQGDRDEAMAARDAANRTYEEQLKAGKNENTIRKNRDSQVTAANIKIEKANKEIGKLVHNDRENKKILTNLAEGLFTEQELIQLQISKGRRASIPDHVQGQVTPATLLQQAASGFGTAEEYEAEVKKSHAQGLYRGGVAEVSGSGTGDIKSAMVASGSLVMNSHAAPTAPPPIGGFKMGGVPDMMPVRLEPGELVYSPGTWNESHLAHNFVDAPRNKPTSYFKQGGVTGDYTMPAMPDWGFAASQHGSTMKRADHPDTGPGWSVGKDAQGRPAVFSQSAAQSLMQIFRDSGGIVKASDIASSTRSPEKNRKENGAPNSNHLYGNAVDIHGTSKAWLKKNGMKYGWKNLVYSGHDGHFDFMKGGAFPIQEQSELTADSDSTEGGGGLQGLIQSLGSMGGKFGEFVSGALGSLQGVFGDDASGLIDAIFGGFGGLGGGGDGSSGDPNVSTFSEPLTGDTLAMAKKMYSYAKGKGLSDAQSKGLVANIHRESTFRPGVAGDNGSSHGLFQWHADRSTKMKAAVPDWSTNWKGQIDYALQEHVGPQYKSATAGMDAKDAAYWWMNKWEIPKDRVRGGNNHRKMNGFIDSYKFQKGGVVGGVPAPSISKSSQQMATRRHLARSSGNNVRVVPMQSGGKQSSQNTNPGAQNQPPNLDAYPHNSIAMDLGFHGISINEGVV